MSSYRFVKTPEELSDYLESIRSAEWIDFDTEFISEGKYRMELCLIQAATEDGLVLLDATKIDDLTPFWERICDPGTLITAHSARSEMEFCFRAVGRLPENLFDIQIAAGFVGLDYPTSLKKLTEEILGIDVPKDETRTDWRARPLSLLQIEYALNDVYYLHRITRKLQDRLRKFGRNDWFAEEMNDYRARLTASFSDQKWERISGISSLGRKELAIVRELWKWRDEKAADGRKRPNHILRDDLIIELARRKTADPERIATLRGLHKRNDLSMFKAELPSVIKKGLAAPEESLPAIAVNFSYPSYPIAGAFLLSVLHNKAKQAGISPNILATPQDVRELVARSVGTLPKSVTPRLTSGWRKTFLGSIPDDILSGRRAVCFADAGLDAPLAVVETPKS